MAFLMAYPDPSDWHDEPRIMPYEPNIVGQAILIVLLLCVVFWFSKQSVKHAREMLRGVNVTQNAKELIAGLIFIAFIMWFVVEYVIVAESVITLLTLIAIMLWLIFRYVDFEK